jgi:hypothetical protein
VIWSWFFQKKFGVFLINYRIPIKELIFSEQGNDKKDQEKTLEENYCQFLTKKHERLI